MPEIAWELAEISTTQLTVIYPEAKNLAPNLLSADGSIAIRFTKEEFTVQLLQRFRRPVVFVPANTGAQAAPLIFDDIPEDIKNGVDYTVEYRQNDTTSVRPAGIIKLWPGGRIEILRK